MGHKTRIMYIECKAGGLAGPARIGRVTYSKTLATIYYQGKQFRSLHGNGFKANYYDVEPASTTGFPALEKTVKTHFMPPMFSPRLTRTFGRNTGLG